LLAIGRAAGLRGHEGDARRRDEYT